MGMRALSLVPPAGDGGGAAAAAFEARLCVVEVRRAGVRGLEADAAALAAQVAGGGGLHSGTAVGLCSGCRFVVVIATTVLVLAGP